MWYRRENGVIVGGPFNCDQGFPVEKFAEDHPEVMAFHASVQANQKQATIEVPPVQ